LALLVAALVLLEISNPWFYAMRVSCEPVEEVYFVDAPASTQRVWDLEKKHSKMLEMEAHGNLSAVILIHTYYIGDPGFGHRPFSEWWVVATTLQPDEHGFIYELVLRTTYPCPSLRKTHTSYANYTLMSPDSGARVIEEFINPDPQYWVGFTNESLRAIGPFLIYRQKREITVILNLNTGNLMVAATAGDYYYGELLLPEGEGLVGFNILDLAMVAKKFQTKAVDSNWDPEADLNNDGIVNIIDISMIAICLGR
jgi:hypothetical protein